MKPKFEVGDLVLKANKKYNVSKNKNHTFTYSASVSYSTGIVISICKEYVMDYTSLRSHRKAFKYTIMFLVSKEKYETFGFDLIKPTDKRLKGNKK